MRLGRVASIVLIVAVATLLVFFNGLVGEEEQLEEEERQGHRSCSRELSLATLKDATLAAREVQKRQQGEAKWCGKHWLYDALGMMLLSRDLPQEPKLQVGERVRLRLINFLDPVYGISLPTNFAPLPFKSGLQQQLWTPVLKQSLPSSECPPCESSEHIDRISIFAAVHGPESFATIASPIRRNSESCDCGWEVELEPFTLPGTYSLELRLLNYAGAASFNKTQCMVRPGVVDGWPPPTDMPMEGEIDELRTELMDSQKLPKDEQVNHPAPYSLQPPAPYSLNTYIHFPPA
jgi:hypothetical protein